MCAGYYDVCNKIYVPSPTSIINPQHLNFETKADRRKNVKHGVNTSRMEINWQLQDFTLQTRLTWFAAPFVV